MIDMVIRPLLHAALSDTHFRSRTAAHSLTKGKLCNVFGLQAFVQEPNAAM